MANDSVRRSAKDTWQRFLSAWAAESPKSQAVFLRENEEFTREYPDFTICRPGFSFAVCLYLTNKRSSGYGCCRKMTPPQSSLKTRSALNESSSSSEGWSSMISAKSSCSAETAMASEPTKSHAICTSAPDVAPNPARSGKRGARKPKAHTGRDGTRRLFYLQATRRNVPSCREVVGFDSEMARKNLFAASAPCKRP